MSDRYDVLHARLDGLEAQLRRWRLFALATMLMAAAGVAGASCSRGDRPDPAPQPLRLQSTDGKQSIELTAAGLEVTADGRRTVIEGGHVLVESGRQQIEVTATPVDGTVTLRVRDGARVAPDITLRVGESGTPASLLMADRKARNFNHLYVNGTAGLEMAGIKEYKNLSTP